MALRLPPRAESLTLIPNDTPCGYLPLGFLPFAEYQLGNGDYFGLYWPIGRESDPPIVAETFHDEGVLVPAYSSLQRFLALAGDEGDDHPEPPDHHADPLSPLACYQQARACLQEQRVEPATALLRQAVTVLPEYTAALALLATQCLRQGDEDEACRFAARALISPPSFGADATVTRMAAWFSQLDRGPQDLIMEPIWRERAQLASIPSGGHKDGGAYHLLRDLIQEYLLEGETVTALTLMQTYGEYMNAETVSFQQRHGYRFAAHWQWQRDISARLPQGPRYPD